MFDLIHIGNAEIVSIESSSTDLISIEPERHNIPTYIVIEERRPKRGELFVARGIGPDIAWDSDIFPKDDEWSQPKILKKIQANFNGFVHPIATIVNIIFQEGGDIKIPENGDWFLYNGIAQFKTPKIQVLKHHIILTVIHQSLQMKDPKYFSELNDNNDFVKKYLGISDEMYNEYTKAGFILKSKN